MSRSVLEAVRPAPHPQGGSRGSSDVMHSVAGAVAMPVLELPCSARYACSRVEVEWVVDQLVAAQPDVIGFDMGGWWLYGLPHTALRDCLSFTFTSCMDACWHIWSCMCCWEALCRHNIMVARAAPPSPALLLWQLCLHDPCVCKLVWNDRGRPALLQSGALPSRLASPQPRPPQSRWRT